MDRPVAVRTVWVTSRTCPRRHTKKSRPHPTSRTIKITTHSTTMQLMTTHNPPAINRFSYSRSRCAQRAKRRQCAPYYNPEIPIHHLRLLATLCFLRFTPVTCSLTCSLITTALCIYTSHIESHCNPSLALFIAHTISRFFLRFFLQSVAMQLAVRRCRSMQHAPPFS